MRLGLLFRETFRGSFHRLDDPLPEHAVDIHLLVELAEWRQLARDGIARVEGTATLEGITGSTKVDGSVRFRLRSENRVPYDLSLVSENGTKVRFRGQREPHPANPL